jgi:hypothetical protein
VVGDGYDADELYPAVLTDVAVRWSRLELLRTLGRTDAADRYLYRAFARRCEHWRTDRADAEDAMDIENAVDIHVWRGSAPPPPRPAWSNAATRLAPYVRPPARADFGPVCEAAVAWWHAYEARRRRRIVTGVVAALVFVVWVAHLVQQSDTLGLAAAVLGARGALTRPSTWVGVHRRRRTEGATDDD